MGIEYFLIKEETNEYFELYKGSWTEIFRLNDEPFLITDKYKSSFDLYEKLLGKVALTYELKTSIGYFEELARKIFSWAGNSVLTFNSDDYFEYDERKKYNKTGTRFFSSDTQLFFVGRHLKITEDQKHTWDIMGVFETEKEAEKVCKDENYFYVPLEIGKEFPEEIEIFKGIVYPKRKEQNNG